MSNLTECAAPARPLPHEREYLEGDTILLQDLQAHLEALLRQAAHVTNRTLRGLMLIELGCIQTVLRGFVVVRTEVPQDALERCLEAVRPYCADGDYSTISEEISRLFNELTGSRPSS